MTFQAAAVEQAVLQFYQTACLHHQVHQWLTAAQISPDAWSFCWELLGTDKNTEVQYFGANTLHVKISRYWFEVPEDQYEGLKTQLLERIIYFGNGPKIVLTRLCVALSSMILHTTPETWPDPLKTLIDMFQQEDIPNLTNLQRCHLLLETLRVLPEEFFSANLAEYRRGILRTELGKSLQHVLPLLQGLMTPGSPPEIFEQALKCFSSWVEFGVPPIDSQQVIIQVFAALQNSQLFDTAVDSLVNVFAHPDSHRFPNTIQKLIPSVLQLKDMYQRAVETPDMDVCNGIAQIVIALAENHTKMLLECSISENENCRNIVMNLIQMVLSCCSLPGHFPVDETTSDMSFTFWYLLQDDILDSEKERQQLLLPIFQPIYFSLIEILLVKVQYPTDEEYESWTAEEKEQFRCYRQDIGDTMMYSFSILREPLLGHLCSVLRTMVENSRVEEVRWQLVEGIFFLFGSVAENVDLEEESYLPAVLNILPKIPFNNIKFVSTALYMIGSFGEWINCHPGSLSAVIPLILQGLCNTEAATAATMALKDVSRENLNHMPPYAHQILTSSQTALESGILKPRECIRLMSCIGQVLSVLKFEEILQYLNTILTPHIHQLEELVKLEPSPSIKNNILLKLNMVSWLVASLDTDREMENSQMADVNTPKPKSNQPKPVFVILQQVAPVIHQLVAKWISDSNIIEAVCDLFKRSLTTLMDDFAPMSQSVAQMVVQMYEVVPQAAILDLAKQLILMFAADAEFSTTVRVLLSALSEKTLQLYQQGVHNYTDVIEAFMAFMAQVLKKNKQLVFDGTCNIPGLFHAGIQAICLPEHTTVKSACSFLNEFISNAPECPVMKQVVETEGHVLMDKVLRAIGGEGSRGVIEHIADIVFTLSKHFRQNLNKWLNEMVEREGYPSTRVSQSEKDVFVKNIGRERMNKRKVRELVKEFTLKCRGLFGTEYVAQAAAML
ncbi:importin-13-like [Argopecten irradians]|uniref:importin-13-like n=1 Tax=Argopecten irradians TaxID=31199 RepID=UPI00371D3543